MFLEFSAANFRSIRDRVTLSLVASTDDTLEEDNVATWKEWTEFRLLKAVAIYGPNAGGKSNLLLAMQTLRDLVLRSSKESQRTDKIPVTPFRLNTKTEGAPSSFEIVFLVADTRYRYGFEADAERVHSEWLFCQRDSSRETTLFTREGDAIKLGADFREGKGLEERTRPNALFLSVVAQFNGRIAGEIAVWFGKFRSISGALDNHYLAFTSGLLRDEAYHARIRDLVRQADVGIHDIVSRDPDPEKLRSWLSTMPPALREQISRGPGMAFELKTLHRKFDGDEALSDLVEFDLGTEGSAGTVKFVGFTGPFLDTLAQGAILVVDELEARLHPRLTKALVGLFNSSANRKNAQLIFATHDVGLLDAASIRRDQVWFLEKDARAGSQLYPLTDFSVRKGAKFQKEYMLGQFGGVPHLGDFRETLLHVGE